MANHPLINTFNAGELSPYMGSRTDLSKYTSGCLELENFQLLPYGGASRRPGIRFITEAAQIDGLFSQGETSPDIDKLIWREDEEEEGVYLAADQKLFALADGRFCIAEDVAEEEPANCFVNDTFITTGQAGREGETPHLNNLRWEPTGEEHEGEPVSQAGDLFHWYDGEIWRITDAIPDAPEMPEPSGEYTLEYEFVEDGENSFYRVTGVTDYDDLIDANVVIPTTHTDSEQHPDPWPVREIGELAFSPGGAGSALVSIRGDSVTSIGNFALINCTALESTFFPSVTTIGDNAFEDCTALTSLYLGATAPTTVGASAFQFSNPTVYVPAGATGYDNPWVAGGASLTVVYSTAFISSTAMGEFTAYGAWTGTITAQRDKGGTYTAKGTYTGTVMITEGGVPEPTLLLGFEFSAAQTFVIELFHKQARFIRNDELVMDGESPYIIESPYSSDDFAGLNSWTQSADVMWLVHPDHPVYRLERRGDTDWRFVEMTFLNPPFLEDNIEDITLTPLNKDSADAWETATEYSLNDVVENDDEVYRCIDDHTSAAGNEPGTGESWEDVWVLSNVLLRSSVPLWDDLHEGAFWLLKHTREDNVHNDLDEVIGEGAATVTVLNCERAALNGEYFQSGLNNGRPRYLKTNNSNIVIQHQPTYRFYGKTPRGNIWRTVNKDAWTIRDITQGESDSFDLDYILIESTAFLPPLSGWLRYYSQGGASNTTLALSNDEALGENRPKGDNIFIGGGQISIMTTGFWYNTDGNEAANLTVWRSINNGATWQKFREWNLDGKNIDASWDEPVFDAYYAVTSDYVVAEKSKFTMRTSELYHRTLCTIGEVHSPTLCDITLRTELMKNFGTSEWSEGAWSRYRGYPRVVTLYENRLVFASTKSRPNTLWLSAVDEYDTFRTGSLDTQAMSITLGSGGIDEIRWLVPHKSLMIGTVGAEWGLEPESDSKPLTPSAFSLKRKTTYGSSGVQAMLVNSVVLFVMRQGRKIREFTYRFDSDEYVAPDMTLLSEHITKSGVARMAFQQQPDTVIACVRNDGVLALMTYERDQEVVGWQRWVLDTGAFETVCVLPRDNDEDLVYVSALVDNKRLIGVFDKREWGTDLATEWNGCDFYKVYDDNPTGELDGLDHLEGLEVEILADGVPQAKQTVNDGKVNIGQLTPDRVVVGLPFTSVLAPMYLEPPVEWKQPVGKRKGVFKAYLRFKDTVGARTGSSRDRLFDVKFGVTGKNGVESATALFNGEREVTLTSVFDRLHTVYVIQDKPLPMTLLAMVPSVEVY